MYIYLKIKIHLFKVFEDDLDNDHSYDGKTTRIICFIKETPLRCIHPLLFKNICSIYKSIINFLDFVILTILIVQFMPSIHKCIKHHC